ncbi:MAG: hypothetical protein EOM44_09700 [Bacteroidia bacterium]|nr:hypothetical protein [Bacteroidia bacterium]
MEELQKRYFQFPLFLLRSLFVDKAKCFNDILSYGVFVFAKNNELDENEISEYFGIEGNYSRAYEKGKAIAEQIPVKEPIPMIDKDKLFEYQNNEKSEFELLKFAVTIGMKSILGTKPYCKTTKEMIFCRAFGFKNMHELEESTPKLFVKYFNRWQTDKILNEIEIENWNLFRYSSKNMRGIYIAKKRKISLEKLIEMVEEKNKKRKIEELKNEKIRLRELALERLNTTTKRPRSDHEATTEQHLK